MFSQFFHPRKLNEGIKLSHEGAAGRTLTGHWSLEGGHLGRGDQA